MSFPIKSCFSRMCTMQIYKNAGLHAIYAGNQACPAKAWEWKQCFVNNSCSVQGKQIKRSCIEHVWVQLGTTYMERARRQQHNDISKRHVYIAIFKKLVLDVCLHTNVLFFVFSLLCPHHTDIIRVTIGMYTSHLKTYEQTFGTLQACTSYA